MTKKTYKQISSTGFVPKGQNTNKLRILFISIALIALLIGGFVGYTIANPGLSTSTIIEEGSMNEPYSYLIFLDDGTYYVKNGTTGAIDYESSNKTTTIQYAIDAIDSGLVVLREVPLPMPITFKDEVLVYEYYEGELNIYPFPHCLGDLSVMPMFFSTAHGMRNEWYVVNFDKDGWHDSSVEFGADMARMCVIEAKKQRYYGTYQWTYYHTGNETDKIFAVGLAWTGECTLAGIYFEQKDDGSLVSITSNNTNLEEQAITDAEWNPNTASILKIVWTATSVKFYVDGVLLNTHSTHIPTGSTMQFLMEVDHYERASNWASDSKIYVKDFRYVYPGA